MSTPVLRQCEATYETAASHLFAMEGKDTSNSALRIFAVTFVQISVDNLRSIRRI